jgi:hypothetical protein
MFYRGVVLRVAEVLERANIPYLITGALAVACYSVPRATADVDVIVPRGANAGSLISHARSAGFGLDKRTEKRVKQVLTRGGVVTLTLPREEFSVDLISRDGASDLIKRARFFKIYGKELPVISPEDLIVEKLLAWRGVDLTDVARIVVSQWKKLDLDNLRRLAEENGIEGQLKKILVVAEREIK